MDVFHSYDVRVKEFERPKLWADDIRLRGRGYFDPQNVTHPFRVVGIEEKDEGLYRCRVDFKLSPTKNSLINVTLIGKSRSKKRNRCSLRCARRLLSYLKNTPAPPPGWGGDSISFRGFELVCREGNCPAAKRFGGYVYRCIFCAYHAQSTSSFVVIGVAWVTRGGLQVFHPVQVSATLTAT